MVSGDSVKASLLSSRGAETGGYQPIDSDAEKGSGSLGGDIAFSVLRARKQLGAMQN